VTGTTGSDLYLVDSSGWVEYIGAGPKASAFARYIEREEHLVLPAVVVYEVYKKLRREGPKTKADQFASQALRANVVPLNEDLALEAAVISLDKTLHMADAIIYATAQAFQAQLITSDTHFQGLPGVTLI
jgi:predicted nucleic acid-binding protein